MNPLSIFSDELVLDCRDVFVEYQVQEYRSRTLKEALINQIRQQNKPEVFRALKGVNVQLKPGECIALIGHNGSGKSTLLKVIAGIIPPTRGSVVRNGTCIPQIELGAGFDPELTGRENIFLSLGLLGLTRKEIENLIPAIVSFSELDAHMDMPIKTYSSGMYMRLGFACSVCIKAELLLVDEILSVGDENFQKKCIAKMREIRSSGSAMVLVTHDLAQVQQMADRVLIFDSGLKVFDGHPREGIAFYHDLMERKRLAALPKDVREEEQRQRELAENDRIRHFGVEVKLRSGVVSSAEGSDRLIAGSPAQLSIDIEILAHQELNPCIGFAIHSAAGQRLVGGNTNMVSQFGQTNFRQPGCYKIQFEIPSLALAAGDYRLITAAHNHNLTKTLDLNGCAQEFQVVNRNDAKNFDEDIFDFDTFAGEGRLVLLN